MIPPHPIDKEIAETFESELDKEIARGVGEDFKKRIMYAFGCAMELQIAVTLTQKPVTPDASPKTL